MAQAAVPNLDADLHIRLKSQVETRAAICEQWLPLWRTLLRYHSASEELAIRIKRIRAAMVSRLALVYAPELSTLSDAEHSQLLVALDILTDFESWGRMREDHGLSIEAARDLWINAIGRMLAVAAATPAQNPPREGGVTPGASSHAAGHLAPKKIEKFDPAAVGKLPRPFLGDHRAQPHHR